ncbi:MAG: glycosyltransferase family 2 protein [Butyrivibrio sp.]|uniref:glycosyltransferase family 2 protein n=1 Tax=Butyrivibrio sp. TaxID=28121 RepID=UPI0025C5D779|nr:glycosyltransferase family 2 protein [Butyrivibrio sp.]MBQ6588745.1 glycosyltransferase family 2 protein [Butyrivibrio sp.]
MESVAVIIPNYNGQKYLTDCLKSLRKQTYRGFKVIMVDNGSTDGSISLVQRDFPEVEVIALPDNTGFANAVNVGIKATQAEYVFLLNNDTICEEGVIAALVGVLDKKPAVFSAQAKMLQIKEPHLIDDAGDYYCALGWAFAPSKDKDNSKYSKRINVTSACAGAAMYRRQVFEEIGYFDEEHFCYLEDVDVGYRARLYGYNNVMEPGAIVYHVGSASSGSRHNAFKVELTAANNLYLIYKNMNALQIIINLPLFLSGVIIKHVFYMKKGLGKAHLKGLSKGFSKIITNSDKRVTFGGRQIANSFLMQLELWVNCIRRLQ